MNTEDVVPFADAMMKLAERIDAELAQLIALEDLPAHLRELSGRDDDEFDAAIAEIDAFFVRSMSALRVARKCIRFAERIAASGDAPRHDRNAVRTRRRTARRMRGRGASYVEIGLELAADPSVNVFGRSEPAGYGWRRYVRGEAPPTPRQLSALVSWDLNRPKARRKPRPTPIPVVADVLRSLDAISHH